MTNVWIYQKHINSIIADIEQYAPLETGGAFFGYIAENGDVVVTELIPAGGKAKRSRYSFEPEQIFQLAEMARLFTTSGGNTTYLGDWHSHPVSVPLLSRRDERTLLKIATSEDARCPNPLMMVIGSIPEKWNINCVRFLNGREMIWLFFPAVTKL